MINLLELIKNINKEQINLKNINYIYLIKQNTIYIKTI